MQQRNRSDQSISFLVNIWANFTDSLLRHEGNLNHATKSSANGCGEKQNLLYELTEEPSYVYRGWFAFDQCLEMKALRGLESHSSTRNRKAKSDHQDQEK